MTTKPSVYRAFSTTRGPGYVVVFTPTDPDVSGLQYRRTWLGALLLAQRIARRQAREA